MIVYVTNKQEPRTLNLINKYLDKQTLKVLDKKPNSFQHCSILTKFSILSWEHLIQFADLVLIFKIINGFAPPVFKDYIHQITGRYTRAGMIVG